MPTAATEARHHPRHRGLHESRAGARPRRSTSAPTSGPSAACSTRCSPVAPAFAGESTHRHPRRGRPARARLVAAARGSRRRAIARAAARAASRRTRANVCATSATRGSSWRRRIAAADPAPRRDAPARDSAAPRDRAGRLVTSPRPWLAAGALGRRRRGLASAARRLAPPGASAQRHHAAAGDVDRRSDADRPSRCRPTAGSSSFVGRVDKIDPALSARARSLRVCAARGTEGAIQPVLLARRPLDRVLRRRQAEEGRVDGGAPVSLADARAPARRSLAARTTRSC